MQQGRETKISQVGQRSLNGNLCKSLFVLFLISFIPRFLSTELAWEIGWIIHDITEVVLAYYLFRFISNDNVLTKSIVLIYIVFGCVMAFINSLDTLSWYYDIDFTAFYFASIPIVILPFLWIEKQVTAYQLPKESDPHNPKNYMIGLRRISTGWGIANFARASNNVMFGGRCVVAGDTIWSPKDGRFSRKKIKTLSNIQNTIFIDSGIPISNDINKRLDKLVGKCVLPIYRDCKSLNVGVDINKLIREKNARK